MSIIYDALKKARIHIKGDFKEDSKVPLSIQKQKYKISFRFFLYLLVIPLGIFIGKLTLSFLTHMILKETSPPSVSSTTINVPNKAVEIEPLVVKSQEKLSEEKPQIEKITSPSLTLNGIVSTEGEPLALINNRIAKKGDYIEGAQVVEIFSDRIELIFEGEKIILQVD